MFLLAMKNFSFVFIQYYFQTNQDKMSITEKTIHIVTKITTQQQIILYSIVFYCKYCAIIVFSYINIFKTKQIHR